MIQTIQNIAEGIAGFFTSIGNIITFIFNGAKNIFNFFASVFEIITGIFNTNIRVIAWAFSGAMLSGLLVVLSAVIFFRIKEILF